MKKLKTIIKKNKNIVNNIIGSFIVRGGALIVSLFTMPAYFSYFGNHNVLGLWFAILSVLNWVLMFDLGLGNGLRNKLPTALANGDNDKAQEYISSTYISMAGLIVIICLIAFISFPFIPWNGFFNIKSNLISHETLVLSVEIVFIGIMLQFVLKLISSILYAIQKSAIVNFLSLLSNILILVFISNTPTMSLEQGLIIMSWINVIAVNLPLFIATIILFSTELKNLKPSFKKYNNKIAIEILKIGSILLWLQIVIMVISSTNELLISFLTNPSYVVEYQVYFKLFNAISSLFVLALVPIWSAVTKAKAEKSYLWIKKLYKILLLMSGLAFVLELAVVPYLQTIVDIWLKNSAINMKMSYAIIFAISNSIFLLHNVNTSIGNGMSYFKVQLIWMTFAAVVDIPLSILFVHLNGGWIGVVVANIISLIPFEILEPIYLNKYLNKQMSTLYPVGETAK